ncbi:MAG: hypothetical protein B7X34_09910, partial [Acidobacteriia bacterium 12-62-4]
MPNARINTHEQKFGYVQAVCDPTGVADSRALLQACIQQMHDIGGGTVELPSGYISLASGALSYTNIANVTLKGQGMDVTYLVQSKTAPCFSSTLTALNVFTSNLHFAEFTVLGDGLAN